MHDNLINLLKQCRHLAEYNDDQKLISAIDRAIREQEYLPHPTEWDCDARISIIKSDNGSYYIRRTGEFGSLLWWTGSAFRVRSGTAILRKFNSMTEAFEEYRMSIKGRPW